MKEKFTERQLTVLRRAAECKDDGWFYLPGEYGAAAGGLARRQLLFSKLDHNGDRRVKITLLGLAEYEKVKS